ncbi:hypothetical protein PRK78_002586 [Emydomyces testavorans]|uniref:Homeodomain-like protein n=1 Tax=Emydomyces testavorans TaxID=2070801 RepID=A0AAF0DGK0_9EURO|nr:hypothetical protein PRK78_002586 [Emydomyces testavorans]
MTDSSMSYEPEEDEDEHEGDITDNNSFRNVDVSRAFGTSSPPLQSLPLDLNCVHDTVPHETRTKRRKRRRPKPRRLALRAAAALPVDTYCELYLESLNDVLGDSEDTPHFYNSQYGVVSWTPREKTAFFAALAKKGKDAIPEIAALVGTKCQMEVRHYLDLLQRSFHVHHAMDQGVKGISLSDIPAAYEVSNECCLALEHVAKASCLRDEQAHNVAGRRKHGDFWLVDYEVAAYVEEELEPEPDAELESISEAESQTEFQQTSELQPENKSRDSDDTVRTHGIFATAKLLKLSNWIRLSERIFMNPGTRCIEDNWNNICLKDESPALTCDAFSDFYALTISITRRLIQSTIFFALSRIRAIKRPYVDPRNLVKKEDVFAAVQVLKMKHNAKAFWAGSARRCSLDVRHTKSGEKYKTVLLSYDEVEALLGATSETDIDRMETESRPPTPVSDISTTSEEELNYDTDKSVPPNGNSTLLPSDYLSDPEEIHANALDKAASRVEEARLWRQVNKPVPAPTDIKAESEDEYTQRKPFAKRKTPHEFANWRDRLLYQAEWETFGQDTAAIDQEMSGNRSRKRRRLSMDKQQS